MSAATEYKVLVNLEVGRGNAKALGGATKGLRQGLAQAERDQQRMRKAESARIKQSEREHKRATAAKLAAEKRAAAELTRQRAEMGRALGSTNRGAAAMFGSVGTGGAASWAKQAGAIITGILAGAVAAGLGKAMSDGFNDNVRREQQTGGIGTTLQLYDFNAHSREGMKNDEGQQFAENLENAKWYQQELQRVADASPGDTEDVATLFQGMLPGMASVTQDAERIVALTQKATLLSAVLDNDFKTVGAQSSRILTGGAGAEFETWNRLQKPIRQAGIEMGVFAKNQQLGEKMTMAFNKLQPEQRLALFEKGLERLGKPIADYYENTYEGITSQAKSTWKAIRMEFAKSPFESLKDGLKGMNKGQGVLGRGSKANENAKEFAGFLGTQVGNALGEAMNIADNAATYIANNWRDIVLMAQDASKRLVQGATLAAGLMGVRAGVGAGMAAGGSILSGVGAIASTTATIGQLGIAAAVALPAIAAMGIVTAGAGILLGGAIAYAVTNIDELTTGFIAWAKTSDDVIQPFFESIDTLGSKFVAMGGYLLGAGDDTSIFTTIVSAGTTVVDTLTGAFSSLIGMTADVIEAFAGAADFFAGIFGGLNVDDAFLLTMAYEKRDALGMQDQSPEAYALDAQIKDLEEKTRTYTERSAGVVSTLRGAREVFDNAKGSGQPGSLEWMAYERLNPMGPAPPPSNTNNKTPPKINMKQNNYNTWHVKDTDPNAIVAGFNKNAARKASVPLRSALAMSRRM